MSVVYVYVVNGVMSGWNISVENVTSGGRLGDVSGKEIWNRRIAVAYGPEGKDIATAYLVSLDRDDLGISIHQGDNFKFA